MATEATNTQANKETENNDTKVTFDERQQARINELIREKQGEAAREVRVQLAEHQKLVEELKAQLTEKSSKSSSRSQTTEEEDVEALKKIITEMKTVTAQRDQELDRFKQQLQAKATEVEKAQQDMLNIRRTVAIRDAASKSNFVDLNIVSKLTEDIVKWDDVKSRFVVMNPDTGTERMNSAFEPMSLDEFYAEYANKNPYLVRGDARGGAGSFESNRGGANMIGKVTVEQVFGPKSDSRIATNLYKADKGEYMRLRKIAVEQGLVR